MKQQYLNAFWSRVIPFNWTFGLAMILFFGVIRFILVLQANVSGQYNQVSLFFLSLWFLPFLFLNKAGRKNMGLTAPKRYFWLPLSFLLGIGISTFMHLSGHLLYGDSIQHWFVYISRSFNAFNISELNKAELRIVFFISAAMSMLFSPIGEELFYRGLIHESFVGKVGDRGASIIDSTAFALTHLAHFGLVFYLGSWHFFPIPALLWVAFLFGACLVFHYCRKMTGSILGAILCHAGYNFGMLFFIVYYIL